MATSRPSHADGVRGQNARTARRSSRGRSPWWRGRIERELHAAATGRRIRRRRRDGSCPAPRVLTRGDASVTLIPPASEQPESPYATAASRTRTFAVSPRFTPPAWRRVCTTWTCRLGVRPRGWLGDARHRDGPHRTSATFSVVAYDENGDVIGGPGLATDGIVCMPLPSDALVQPGGGCVQARMLGVAAAAERFRSVPSTPPPPRFYQNTR